MEPLLIILGLVALSKSKKQTPNLGATAVNGTTRQVYEYYRTQTKIKDLKKRSDYLKKDASELLLKTHDSKNLSTQEKDFLRKQIVESVNL